MEQTKARLQYEHHPHSLNAWDQEAFLAAEGRAEALPACWRPFGPPALGAWLGPNGAVAKADKRGKLALCHAGEARALLIDHAFRSTTALWHAAQRIAPETPLTTLRTMVRENFPGYVPVEDNPGTTLHLVRMGEPVIRFSGKYDTAEWAEIIEGEQALDYVLANAPKAAWTTPQDELTVTLDAPEGKQLLRAILYALAVLLVSPIVAAPILLLDAILWLIAVGFVWIIAIMAAQPVLKRWEESRARPQLRIDPWRVWLPGALGGHVLDRSQIDVWMDWSKPFGTYTSGQAGKMGASVRNPARTYLHLKSQGLHLQLSHTGEPPSGTKLPLIAKGNVADEVSGMPRLDLWKLAAALTPEMRRSRAAKQAVISLLSTKDQRSDYAEDAI